MLIVTASPSYVLAASATATSASFTGDTLIVTVTALDESGPSLTVKLKLPAPL